MKTLQRNKICAKIFDIEKLMKRGSLKRTFNLYGSEK